MEIERLTARVEADTRPAERSLDRLDRKIDEAAEDRTAVITVTSDDTKIKLLDEQLDEAAEDRTAVITVVAKKTGSRFGAGFDLMDEIEDEIAAMPTGARSPIARWVREGFSDGAAAAFRKFEGAGFGKILSMAIPSANANGGIFDMFRNDRGGFNLMERVGDGMSDLVGVFDNMGDAIQQVGKIATEAGDSLMGVTTNMFDVAQAGGDMGKGAASGASGLAGAAAGGIGLAVALGLVIGVVATLLPLIVALGGAVVGLVIALAPLVGLLGLLPGLIFGVAGAAVVLFAAFKGITEALGEYMTAQEDAEKLSVQLQDAQRAEAQAAVGLARAQRDMANARRDAAEAIEDAQFAAEAAQLSQQRAVLGLERAYKRLADVQARTADKTTEITKVTDDFTGKQFEVARITFDAVDQQQDMADALLAVQEAELALRMAQDRREDTALTLYEMQQKGIEQSDIMIDRQLALESATAAYAAAIQSVADATTALDGGKAFGELGEAGQGLVESLAGLMGTFETFSGAIQEALLPAVTLFVDELSPFIEEMTPVLTELADAFGSVFDELTALLQSPEFKGDFQTIVSNFADNLETMAPGLTNIANAFADIVIAAQPMFDFLAGAFVEMSEEMENWAAGGSEMGDLTPWFEKTAEVLDKVFQIVGNLVTGFTGLMEAGEGFGDFILDGIVEASQAFTDFTNSAEGQEKIASFFERLEAPLSALADLMGVLSSGILETFGSPEAMAFLETFATTMAEDVMPAVFNLFDLLYESGTLDNFMLMLGGLADAFNLLYESGVLTVLADLIGLFNALTSFPATFLLDPTEAVQNLIDKFTNLKDDIIGLPEAIGDTLSGLFDPLSDSFKTVVNAIVDWFNGLSITLPDVKYVPGLDGQKIPLVPGDPIPRFEENALGGQFKGLSLVGERGPELISSGNRTMSVFNNADTRSFMRNGGGGGLSASDLERIVDRMVERVKPDVKFDQTFNEKVDPRQVASDVAWKLAS